MVVGGRTVLTKYVLMLLVESQENGLSHLQQAESAETGSAM